MVMLLPNSDAILYNEGCVSADNSSFTSWLKIGSFEAGLLLLTLIYVGLHTLGWMSPLHVTSWWISPYMCRELQLSVTVSLPIRQSDFSGWFLSLE